MATALGTARGAWTTEEQVSTSAMSDFLARRAPAAVRVDWLVESFSRS